MTLTNPDTAHAAALSRVQRLLPGLSMSEDGSTAPLDTRSALTALPGGYV